MDRVFVNKIYLATEGEGVHIGTPQIFVRLQGCQIKCINCDSMQTWAHKVETEHSIGQVIDEVVAVGSAGVGTIKRVSITGGDPLFTKQLPGLLVLIKELRQRRYYVNIEVSGLTIEPAIFDSVNFIGFDFKTPSTGIFPSFKNIVTMAEKFPDKFQVKAVIESEKDFKATLLARQQVIDKGCEIDFPWVLTPAYNLKEAFPMERFKKVVALNEENGSPFRVIGQQHKWIYGPDRQGV